MAVTVQMRWLVLLAIAQFVGLSVGLSILAGFITAGKC